MYLRHVTNSKPFMFNCNHRPDILNVIHEARFRSSVSTLFFITSALSFAARRCDVWFYNAAIAPFIYSSHVFFFSPWCFCCCFVFALDRKATQTSHNMSIYVFKVTFSKDERGHGVYVNMYTHSELCSQYHGGGRLFIYFDWEVSGNQCSRLAVRHPWCCVNPGTDGQKRR